jgi:hypothetical protein
MQNTTGHLSMRLERTVIDALDAEAAELAAQNPGMRITRADVARRYLLAGMRRDARPSTAADILNEVEVEVEAEAEADLSSADDNFDP